MQRILFCRWNSKQTTIFQKQERLKFVIRKLQAVASCCGGLCQMYGCGLAKNLIRICLILNLRSELSFIVVLLQPQS
jgi:hypothetical protein